MHLTRNNFKNCNCQTIFQRHKDEQADRQNGQFDWKTAKIYQLFRYKSLWKTATENEETIFHVYCLHCCFCLWLCCRKKEKHFSFSYNFLMDNECMSGEKIAWDDLRRQCRESKNMLQKHFIKHFWTLQAAFFLFSSPLMNFIAAHMPAHQQFNEFFTIGKLIWNVLHILFAFLLLWTTKLTHNLCEA